MDYRLNALDGALPNCGIANVTSAKLELPIPPRFQEGGYAAVEENVQGTNAISARKKLVNDDRSDVSGTT